MVRCALRTAQRADPVPFRHIDAELSDLNMLSPQDRPSGSRQPVVAQRADSGEVSAANLGEMVERIRDFDWSQTDLGPIDSWCAALRTLLSMCLDAAFPTAIYWGPQLRLIYNDQWATLLGDKHPHALGQPAQEVWSHMWDEAGARLHQVLESGKGVLLNDQPFLVQRDGALLEKHWSYSLTPVRGEDGEVAGIFTHAREMTALLRARQERESMLSRMREMFQQAPGAIAVLSGPEHMFEIANAAFERLVGRTDVIGTRVQDKLPELVSQGLIEILDTVYRTGEPYIGRAFPVRLQRHAPEEAETLVLDFVYQPLRDIDGQVRGIFMQASDVTDRVRMEVALRASEERLSHALTGGSIGACDWDIRNDRMTADERFARLYGIDPLTASKGMPLASVMARVHPDQRAGLERALADAMESGETFEREFRLLHEDGSIRWVIARGRCTVAADGTPMRFSGVSFDITDRKNVEEALRHAKENREFVLTLAERHRGTANPQELMRATAQALGERLHADRVGFFQLIDNDEIEYGPSWSNGKLPLLSGRLPTSSLGAGLNDIVRSGETIAFADCRSDARVSSDLFLQIGTIAGIGVPLVRNGEWEAGLYVHQTRARRWKIEEIALVEEVAESAWDWSEHARAAQALAESEERFRAITNSIDQMIWSTRPDGYHDFYNDRWYEYTGVQYGSTDGAGWNDMFHPDDQERAWKVWSESLATGKPYHIEYRLRHHSGHYRWVLGRAQPVRDPEGRIVRWFGTCTDIQEIIDAREVLARSREDLEREVYERTDKLMKAEEQLRQAQKMEAIGQLTGGIAHDFNNMLAVVQGGLRLLQRRLARGETDVGKYIDGAIEGANRAAVLTQRLLAFARQQPLTPVAVDANRMVAGMQDLIARALGESIQIDIALADDAWLVRADPNQLENVILNLAVNARDAMPKGGRLRLQTINTQLEASQAKEYSIPPGEYVLFCVTDTGIGMTKEVMTKAFDPFFTTKGVGKGTGLGLSQAFGFVRQSGGHVKIDSQVGVGTTLSVYLPRYYGAPEMLSRTAAKPPLAGRVEEVVLVVEDEVRVRSFSVETLKELGYTAIAAESPADALRIIESGQRIDLLFTDVVMPDMTGPQLAQAATARVPGLKVLFTTGYSRAALMNEGASGPIDFLPKPFDIEQLATKVRAALDAPLS